MNRFTKLFAGLIAVGAIARCVSQAGEPASSSQAPAPLSERGQFGSELALLSQFYAPPKSPGESNHYFEMWDGPKVRAIATANGLLDNHALFINSHGDARTVEGRSRYAFCPHQNLVRPGQPALCFSAQDLARFLGPAKVKQIHNLIIGGCDSEACLSAAELRSYFTSATNITHVLSGERGYQVMFVQSFVNHSADIQPLYESSIRNPLGKAEYFMASSPVANATKFSPYVADLFRPGETTPFKRQIAGRELLEPPSEPADLPDNSPSLSMR
jgi:hypothetical protein